MRPLIFLSNPAMQSLSFFWMDNPRIWVGYRFSEGLPETESPPIFKDVAWPTVDWEAPRWGTYPELDGVLPPLLKATLPRKRWRSAYREKDRTDPTQLDFQVYQDGSAWCRLQEGQGRQQRELFFQPVEDGVQMWMKLSTQSPIAGSYQVQQCLRFTGAQNWSLRRNIACVPFLSELDLQAMGHPDLTLTYARLGDEWLHFPARHVRYATPSGSGSIGNGLDGQVDSGLIVRETLDRRNVPASYFRRTALQDSWERIASGMYWERTAWISNRHPADCVHAVVDLGPLAEGESRTVRGKFYWIAGTKDDLLAAWRKDFPG